MPVFNVTHGKIDESRNNNRIVSLNSIREDAPNTLKFGAIYMSKDTQVQAVAVPSAPQSGTERFLAWIEEPFGQVVVASAATIGSFGLVLSGIWFVNIIVN